MEPLGKDASMHGALRAAHPKRRPRRAMHELLCLEKEPCSSTLKGSPTVPLKGTLMYP